MWKPTPRLDAAAESDRPASWSDGIKHSLTRPEQISGMLCTAGPTAAFLAANGPTTLGAALGAAAITALAAFAYRILTKQPMRPAIIGLAIVAVCAAAAAVTGDARGFFLAPTMATIAILAVCLGTVAARRPLAGLLLNRVSQGPAHWYRHRPLLRVYTICTLVCAVVNVCSAVVQIIGYAVGNTVLLAAAHIANPPIFTVVITITVMAARKARLHDDNQAA
jgi:hypothetical protein